MDSTYNPNIDFPIHGSISSISKQNFLLVFQVDDFEKWLRDNWTVESWVPRLDPKKSRTPEVAFKLEKNSQIYATAPGFELEPSEIEGTITFKSGAPDNILLEYVTPRFIYQFARSFQERFPENKDIGILFGGYAASRLDATLSDQDGGNKVLEPDSKVSKLMDVDEDEFG